MSWDDNLLKPEAAGSAGALIGFIKAIADGKALRFIDKIFQLLAGLALAWFIAPWVQDQWGVTQLRSQNALAFVVCFVGVNLLIKFSEWIQRTPFADLVRSFITKSLPTSSGVKPTSPAPLGDDKEGK